MSKDLYVKNIATEITEEELRKLFAVCGKVTYVHMVKDAKSGEFVGCAYVKMSSEAEAKDARVSLDGARFGNREIIVVEALPQRPSGTAKPAPRKGAKPASAVAGSKHPAASGARKPLSTKATGKDMGGEAGKDGEKRSLHHQQGKRPAGGFGRKPGKKNR